jgi:hypothetical protein
MDHFDSISHDRAAFSTFDQAPGFRDTHGGTMDAPEYLPSGATWRIDIGGHTPFNTPVRQMRGIE